MSNPFGVNVFRCFIHLSWYISHISVIFYNVFFDSYIYIYIYIYEILYKPFAQSAGAVEYTDCISAEEKDPPTSVLIWVKAIRWCGSNYAGALGNSEYPFAAIASRSTLAWCGSTLWSPIYGPSKMRTMLNWITWNRTVLIFKLCTYAKLNCLKKNCLTKLDSLK